jgi:carboxymethylenebutenolidase
MSEGVNNDNMIRSTFNPPAQMVAVPRPDAPDRPLDAYLVRPEGDGRFPGVVVIHEIFGLNDNIRDIAGRFADQGYVALAVDLFSTANRAMCMLRIFYGMLLRPLKNGTLADLQAALDFLHGQPQVNAARVGVIGFCMGGTFALQLACVDDDLRAASVFYGQNPRPLEAVAQACPIVGSYPGKDFTARAARKLEPLLEQHNVPHDIKVYPDARHSFFNDQGGAYDPEAAADAWARTLAFFETHLK